MYPAIQTLHSYWAYLVLLVLLLATVNAILGINAKRDFRGKDLRISLFALIVSHIQLLIGIVLYFASPYIQAFSEYGMGGVMKDSTLRLYLIEHPFTNILAIVLITIGWSRHKRKADSTSKYKSIGIFYLLGLILLLSRIPWSQWLG